MSTAHFVLSAFGDEIADELDEQLALLREIDIRYLELRGVWGKNVVELTTEEAERVATACAAQDIQISAIGSPIGKSPLADPITKEVEKLHHIAHVAETLGTKLIRVFSFYPPDATADSPQHLSTCIARLETLVATAEEHDLYLLLENEKGIVGDTVDRCATILDSIQGNRLKFAWDPANFVQVGNVTPTDDGWSKLGGYTAHVHIKDIDVATRQVMPAGQGSGQIPALLANLRDTGFQGFLALEPHLALAGHSSGFSGPDGMRTAAAALREILAKTGCAEEKACPM